MKKETITPSNEKKNENSFFSEFLKFVLLAAIVVLPIRMFIAQPFIVSGSSMSPTFDNGEYLIIDEISYRFNEPQRGDIIVFKFPQDKSKFFIKRIIGLPDETVEIINGQIQITNDENSQGLILEEDYVSSKSLDNGIFALESDEYFVMGDNRTDSLDSRNWGPLSEEYIKGRAFLRLLPVEKIGVFPGSIENFE
jgi:signal peptidase I